MTAHLSSGRIRVNVVGQGGVFDGVAPGGGARVIEMSNGFGRERAVRSSEGTVAGEQRARVLLVEDDADSLAVLAELLSSHYEVLCAQDAEQALAIAQA